MQITALKAEEAVGQGMMLFPGNILTDDLQEFVHRHDSP